MQICYCKVNVHPFIVRSGNSCHYAQRFNAPSVFSAVSFSVQCVKMRSIRQVGYLLLFCQIPFLSSYVLPGKMSNKIQIKKFKWSHTSYSHTGKLNTKNTLLGWWNSFLKSRTHKAPDVAKRHLVDRIMMDGIVGEMHLDKQKVNTDSQRPLRINIDSGTDVVSGYFFNFHGHKPTFKVDSKDQLRVSLTGGPLNSTYLMDQFHFHVYCTREEAEQNTLDKAQVPGELHLVFFREKYQSYKKALNKFQDGLAVVAIYLKVGEDDSKNHEIEKFSSYADYISRDENRTVSTTASIEQLTTPVSNEHAQYDAYRGNLVEPVQCEHCVDVFVMKQPFIMSVKQMTEFRKAPHCVENDWAF